jgi:AcrR family transcriptional regulator
MAVQRKRAAKAKPAVVKKTAGRRPHPRIDAREQLLTAANDLMIEKRSIDVPIGEIARLADLNSALISYYFGGKKGFLLALAKRAASSALRDMDELMHLDWPVELKLRYHIAGIINFHFRYPYITRLNHILLRDASSKNARDLTKYFSEPVIEMQAKLLKEGFDRGIFRRIDPTFFYFSVIGACDYLFWGGSALEFVFNIKTVDEEMRRKFIEHTADLFLRGCLVDTTKSIATPASRKRK